MTSTATTFTTIEPTPRWEVQYIDPRTWTPKIAYVERGGLVLPEAQTYAKTIPMPMPRDRSSKRLRAFDAHPSAFDTVHQSEERQRRGGVLPENREYFRHFYRLGTKDRKPYVRFAETMVAPTFEMTTAPPSPSPGRRLLQRLTRRRR